MEVSHTTVNKQHNISHRSLVPLNELLNEPQSDTHKAEEQFDACRSCFWCVGSRCPVDGESGPVWKSSPAGTRDLDLGQVTTFDLLVRNSDKTIKQQQRHKQRPQHFHPRLSLCSGWWCEASTASHQTVSIRPFFFFAEKTFHTQSKNNSLRLAVW